MEKQTPQQTRPPAVGQAAALGPGEAVVHLQPMRLLEERFGKVLAAKVGELVVALPSVLKDPTRVL